MNTQIQKLELYPTKKEAFNKLMGRLDQSPISEVNKQLIRGFQSYLFSTGSGEKRVTKLTCQLLKMLLFVQSGTEQRVFNCDFNDASKQDVLNLISFVNRHERFSLATKSDYRRCLKQLYRWLREEDGRLESRDDVLRKKAEKVYQFLEKDVSISYKKEQIDPTTILSEDDIEKVLSNGCRNIKEKAFVRLLHETGLRAGEMLNLRIKDVEIKKNIGVVHVDGKTGRRPVQFVQSLSQIAQWLENHPFKSDLNSFLWLGESSCKMWEPLIHQGAQKLINRCFSRADVKKKHNQHWFRHSRASLLAPKLTEVLLCKYMGWSIGSRQPKTYVHLCPQQLEDAFLKLNGLAEEEDNQKLPQKCGCGSVNDSSARYCYRCGNPLSIGTAIQDQELVKSETDKTVQFLMEIMKNKELLKQFMEFKKNLGENKIEQREA